MSLGNSVGRQFNMREQTINIDTQTHEPTALPQPSPPIQPSIKNIRQPNSFSTAPKVHSSRPPSNTAPSGLSVAVAASGVATLASSEGFYDIFGYKISKTTCYIVLAFIAILIIYYIYTNWYAKDKDTLLNKRRKYMQMMAKQRAQMMDPRIASRVNGNGIRTSPRVVQNTAEIDQQMEDNTQEQEVSDEEKIYDIPQEKTDQPQKNSSTKNQTDQNELPEQDVSKDE